MKIAIAYRPVKGMVLNVTDELVNRLKEAFPEDEVYYARSLQELKDRGIKADCILGGCPSFERLEHEINFDQYFEWSRSLQWFQTIFTGVEAFRRDSSFALGKLSLVNAAGLSAIPISDHIMAFILSFARCLDEAWKKKTGHIWSRPADSDDLEGKTLGIIGIGNIGKLTARKAKAFGMKVLGFKRTPAEIEYTDQIYYGSEGLKEMLGLSDYVVMLLPNTPENLKFMSAEEFAAMKPGAFFINAGRGVCVDTDALISAVDQGIIKGAALDAVDPEPLPDDSPLWDMDHVIITSHYAGDTKRTFDRALDLFIENIRRFKEGKDLQNTVKV